MWREYGRMDEICGNNSNLSRKYGKIAGFGPFAGRNIQRIFSGAQGRKFKQILLAKFQIWGIIDATR